MNFISDTFIKKSISKNLNIIKKNAEKVLINGTIIDTHFNGNDEIDINYQLMHSDKIGKLSIKFNSVFGGLFVAIYGYNDIKNQTKPDIRIVEIISFDLFKQKPEDIINLLFDKNREEKINKLMNKLNLELDLNKLRKE